MGVVVFVRDFPVIDSEDPLAQLDVAGFHRSAGLHRKVLIVRRTQMPCQTPWQLLGITPFRFCIFLRSFVSTAFLCLLPGLVRRVSMPLREARSMQDASVRTTERTP